MTLVQGAPEVFEVIFRYQKVRLFSRVNNGTLSPLFHRKLFVFRDVRRLVFAGLVMPVSVWVKKLEAQDPRCVVVMEPVDRTTASVSFDSNVSSEIFRSTGVH